MHLLRGHRRAVRAVAYAPGPTPLLVSAGDDHTLHLWDPLEGKERGHLQTPRDAVLSLAFSPEGRLASGGSAGMLFFWDVEEQEPLARCAAFLSPINTLVFTADGRALFAGLRSQRYGGEPGRLLYWDLQSTQPYRDAGWVGEVESVTFSPSRELFAIGRLDRGLELWEMTRPQTDPITWMPSRVRAVCFSPTDGRLLAVATGRMIQIRNVEESRWIASCSGHRADVTALAFSTDGRRLLSGGADRSVRLWETHSGRQLGAWDWQIGPVNAVAIAPDGMTGACGGDKPTVVVWDLDE